MLCVCRLRSTHSKLCAAKLLKKMKSRPSEGADFALGQTEIPFVGHTLGRGCSLCGCRRLALGRGCSLCGCRWPALGLRVQPVRKPVACLGPRVQPVRKPVARLGPRVQPVRMPVACDGPWVQPVRKPVARLGPWVQPVRKPVARLGAAEKNKEELRTPLYCVPRAGVEPARVAPLVFETSASTDSAIWA